MNPINNSNNSDDGNYVDEHIWSHTRTRTHTLNLTK